VTQAIYQRIVAYMEAHDGVSPTRHEIASGLGLGEGGHLHFHLRKLEAAGLIVLVPGRRFPGRNIRLPEREAPAPAQPVTPAAEQSPLEYWLERWGASA
jgi:SOS-response transcriptional repressor LexA